MNPYYIVPFFDRLFCCFPKSCRDKLYCGAAIDDAILNEDGHIPGEGEDDEKDEVRQMDTSIKSLHLFSVFYDIIVNIVCKCTVIILHLQLHTFRVLISFGLVVPYVFM